MGNQNSGRRPKPTALKVLQGNPGKRKLNQHEPKPPQGEAKQPKGLSLGAIAVWAELAPLAMAMGTLTTADVRAFATLCELQATFQQITAAKDTKGQLFTLKAEEADSSVPEMVVFVDNLIRVEREAAAALRPYYERFGLEPVGRARIVLPAKETAPVSKWAGVLA